MLPSAQFRLPATIVFKEESIMRNEHRRLTPTEHEYDAVLFPCSLLVLVIEDSLMD